MVYLLRKNIKTKQSSNKLNYIKLGLFKIKDKLGLVTFQLNLLKRIRIYLVFHVLLLELASDNTRLELIQINKKT